MWVGVSDNIFSGELIFMVEMNEMVSIMNNILDCLFIFLDEIGWGISIYDGISIVWFIVEYLYINFDVVLKMFFVMYYYEFNELVEKFLCIYNFNVVVKEVNNKVIFLCKLVVGGSQYSFGIYVVKMVGMLCFIVLWVN